MNQIKIGKFIAECRKKENLTQMQLAEKLGITDRAISKWENGKTMPDSSLMLELCDILKITVNDLLRGEVVTVEHYNKELENNLLDMVKEKEKSDKHLLTLEVVIVVVSCIYYFGLVAIASLLPMAEWFRVVIALGGLVPFLAAMFFAIKIEQVAGYYECKKCGHRYVPTYKAVNLAPHMGRTRHMRCPKCNQKSWQKKVISKDE